MSNKIQLLDGAAGTTMWEHTIDRGPVWRYNVIKQDIVKQVATEFYEAGAKIVTTNTFAANRPSIKHEGGFDPAEIVCNGVRLAKEALAGKDCLVALDCGPLSDMLEPFGTLSAGNCRRIFEEMISNGMQEHPDMIYLMTFMDVEMMKIAVNVAKQYQVPVFASMTFTEFGATMMGNTPTDIVAELEPMGIDAIGMNCSLGPDKALPIIKEFKEATSLPTLFKPNAGLPITNTDGQTTGKPCTPEEFAKSFIPAFPYADYVGGCCGTNKDYLKAIKTELDIYQNK
jgi:5-methyltetrahydrofolate--homocysteine methyltransferase